VNFCIHCGAALGPGRFCTNCGAPIDRSAAATTTAAPTAPTVPAGPVEPVAPVEAFGPATTYRLPDSAPVRPAAPRPAATTSRRPDRHSNLLLWILLAIGVVLAALLGSCLATAGQSADEPSTAASSATPSPTTASATPTDVETGRAGEDLAALATVDAPDPIRPGTDVDGSRVPYPATNMLDESRDTAYRLAGNATGTVIRFDLGGTRTVSAVGIVNGYAKVDGGTDWYPRNRRIEQVEWRFDDGTIVLQDLVDTPDLQAIQVTPEETTTVELRLVRVSAPGGGRSGKDTTAISDVLLLGS
jgi:hypothetical protein